WSLFHEVRSRRAGDQYDVVDHVARTRPQLKAFDPLVFGETGRHDEVRVLDGALLRHRVGRRHFDDLVRLPDRPAFGERAGRRSILPVAFFGAGVGPGGEGVDFGLRQRAIILELAEVRIGVPRRHALGDDGLADGLGPRTRLLIRH